jgi:hypothetical protein
MLKLQVIVASYTAGLLVNHCRNERRDYSNFRAGGNV